MKNDMTPVAKTLKMLGVEVIAFDFDGTLCMIQYPDNGEWTIPTYTDKEKKKLLHHIKSKTSDDAIALLLACLYNGIYVVIATHQDHNRNGQIHPERKEYRYEGEPLIREFLKEVVGPEWAERIPIIDNAEKGKKGDKIYHMKQIQKIFSVKPHEICMVDDRPQVIQVLRQKGYLAMFVEQANEAFQVSDFSDP